MTLLFIGEIENPDIWIAEFNRQMPELKISIYPNLDSFEEVEAVLTFRHPLGSFKQFPNLKVIIATGAGVDHILRDPDLPAGIPIVRLVDESLTSQMSEYVMLAVLRFHRQLFAYQHQQNQRHWQGLPPRNTQSCVVGVLGLGVLGLDVAEKLTFMGFTVRGWSRTPKRIEKIDCFWGQEQFDEFLSQCSVLVCLLPLTPETEGILNRKTFAAVRKGAYIINVARGQHLVEEDLLEALKLGQISGACLDVFKTEPLPENHPFWSSPQITITPHIAAKTIPACVAPQIIDAIQRSRSQLPLNHVVDLQRGY